jgi:Lipocalin-like domain
MGAVAADALVGTWRLIAACAYVGDTQDSSPLGRSPSGLLIYTRDGTMAALISYDERKPLSVADWIAAPSDEQAGAFTTFLAYGGRYALADGWVTHGVEVASVEKLGQHRSRPCRQARQRSPDTSDSPNPGRPRGPRHGTRLGTCRARLDTTSLRERSRSNPS